LDRSQLGAAVAGGPGVGATVQAVILGPGRIGCGLVGLALRAGGYDVTFVGRDPELVAHLQRVGGYRVLLTGGGRSDPHQVYGVSCLDARDVEHVAAAVADADLVATAVGSTRLAGVAPLIAAGLARRGREPLSILAFENEADPGRRLGRLVADLLPDRSVPESVGFASALAHRVVSRRVGDVRGELPLTFVGDPPAGVDVDGSALAGSPPSMPGLLVADDYPGCVRRKMFVFGAGHATAAYLGALKGYHFVHAAVRDPEIRREVFAALREGCAALGLTDCGAWHPAAVLRRYENAALDDTVARVGREPLRKLEAGERIVGPARAAVAAGTPPRALALTAAAALVAAVPTRDPAQTRELLQGVCRLSPRHGLGREVWRRWTRLADGGGRQAVLLSLSRPTWSWVARPGPTVPLGGRVA
jgi:mannitol-1-phosphate 5-dehydrogenase